MLDGKSKHRACSRPARCGGSACYDQTPLLRCAMLEDHLREALTFDDVLLVPAYSEVIPRDVDVTTRLTPAIPLRMPLVSSAMDTVTEAATAIRMDREGGACFIHKHRVLVHQGL